MYLEALGRDLVTMTPFSASPETTNRLIRPVLDEDMRRAVRHARTRRRHRRAQRVLTRY
jgi:hypothetical protein